MSSGKFNHHEQKDNPLLSQPGYSYHRQTPPVRSHYVRPSKSTPSHEKPPSTNAIVRKTIFASVLTFVAVIGVMLLILVLAVLVSTKMWNLKQEQITKQTRRPSAPLVRRTPREGSEFRSLLARKTPAPGSNEVVLSSETIANYQDTLAMWSYAANPWMAMGRFYLAMNDHARARAALELSIGTNWFSAEVYNDLGVTHLQQNDYRKAQSLFERIDALRQ